MTTLSKNDLPTMKIGQTEFDFSRPYVMGIVNLTPDSFSDGGQFTTEDGMWAHVDDLISQGADFIDVGAESSRPGAQPVSVDDEIDRLRLFLQGYKKRFNVPLSLDTTKSEVAQFGLDHGVDIINDISGLSMDPKMGEVISRARATVILMHMKGTPGSMQKNPTYEDVVEEVVLNLTEKVEKAKHLGIKNVIIDPGIGFGKSLAHNLSLLNGLDRFFHLNCAILVGPSRKSFIGYLLDKPASERVYGTVGSCVAALSRGAHIFRVHDVSACRDALVIGQAIFKG